MSGKKIKKDLREKELRPTMTYDITDRDGNKTTYTTKRFVKYENRGLYDKNRVQKRHVENPNIYEGEKPLPNPGTRNIRLPRKCRKTAWKRFKKAFPYVKVDKKGNIQYVGNGTIQN